MKVQIKQAQKDLQELLDENGSKTFPKLKALYLKDVQLVNAKGEAIDAEELDVEIRQPQTKPDHYDEEEVIEEEEELGMKAEDEDEDEMAKSLVSTLVKKELSMRDISTTQVKSADPFMVNRGSSIKHFKTNESAYRFGRWAMGCMGHTKSAQYCKDYGIQIKGQRESVNTLGGYLVPDEFSSDLINLREEFGVFRANAKIEPMSSDTKRIPRRDSTLSASFVGETAAGTDTTQKFSQVNLVAKKLMVLSVVSSELQEDALINLGDTIAGEIAYAFSNKEDECGFNGDGSATFGGIIGLKDAIAAGGIYDSTRSAADATLADIHSLLALLPQFADTPKTKFYMHKSMYHALVERLFVAQGGSPGLEFSNGQATPMILGYPVVFSQVMSKSTVTANGTTLMYFGDMTQSSYLGDRRSNTIAFSESALNAFEQDEMVVRGTERFDIVNTNVGTAALAGSMVKMTV